MTAAWLLLALAVALGFFDSTRKGVE